MTSSVPSPLRSAVTSVWAVDEGGVDHPAREGASVIGLVDDDLVAVPWLDGRDVERAGRSPDGNVARAAFRNRCGLARGYDGVSPAAMRVFISMNPGKPGGQQARVAE
jgi:hypothetical protein